MNLALESSKAALLGIFLVKEVWLQNKYIIHIMQMILLDQDILCIACSAQP